VGEAQGLRERKKRRTHSQLAVAALELVEERGLSAVRVDDICARAEVGRSTFFRYYDSKETAFVAGLYQGRLDAVLDALAARPPDEPAFAAVRAAFLEVVAAGLHLRDALLLEARIRATSPAVHARACALREEWERPIAALLVPRYHGAADAALMAVLAARLAMTAVQVASDAWVAAGAHGSPTERIEAAFDAAVAMIGDAR
jgi:AcrR family transcriptional regulator